MLKTHFQDQIVIIVNIITVIGKSDEEQRSKKVGLMESTNGQVKGHFQVIPLKS